MERGGAGTGGRHLVRRVSDLVTILSAQTRHEGKIDGHKSGREREDCMEKT